MGKKEKHSEAFLGRYRDFWWNPDFVDLMAKRWNLRRVLSVADIGCGLGHWSRLLFRYLNPKAKLVGIDLEKDYVEKAAINFKHDYPKIKKKQYSFITGNATLIPLPSNSFDLVTCQTLLIHLKDPERALREMIRVARPGGLIICSEPNNIFESLELNSINHSKPVETLTKTFEYAIRYERGKMNLGEGYNSFGDLLPGIFAKVGLKDIKVYISDKAQPLFPPYRSKEQQIILKQMEEWREKGTGEWNRELYKRRILAGGGSDKFFNSMWRIFESDFKKFKEAIKRKEYFQTGGMFLYLVSGVKNRIL
ncbi:MAG: class I SAM-dependent methyltransferase [Patescibacteria group bacterium]